MPSLQDAERSLDPFVMALGPALITALGMVTQPRATGPWPPVAERNHQAKSVTG